ncbi:WhiB family transcriptional regulator [Streptodolium elevatio]|uniref:WhiB family transcriptional regulator n=1 Tax=Streptodolium elevatio TaxID=3157996 RepID=A0ABV3DU79_9ACTN
MTAPATLAPRPRLDGTEPCLRPGVDPDLFSPDYESDAALAAAAVYCRACPRIADCLAWAVDAGESGIWAATTTAQRKQLREQHGITTRIPGLTLREVTTMTTALKPSPAAYAPGTPDAVAAELARQDDTDAAADTTIATTTSTTVVDVPVQPKLDPAPAADRSVAHRHGTAGSEPPSVADVIAAARATGDAKLTAQADKTEAAIGTLVALVSGHQALARAEDEVERLAAKLAAAKARVRDIKQGKATTPTTRATKTDTAARRTTDGPKVDPKRVRAWAADNNIECNSQGIVRREVVAAYIEAMNAEGALA